MPLENIESFLETMTGMDAQIVGSDTIGRAVRERMRNLDQRGVGGYYSLLKQSNEELHALVDEVLVPETWFLRDWEPFTFLSEFIANEWIPSRRGRALRILSIPCSTGEEPYSIAMTLFDGGMTGAQFQIDAVDISHRALKKARLGIYGRNSFRGEQVAFRDRHFEKIAEGYRLNDAVRSAVHFFQGNIVDHGSWNERGRYDVIFCRNLLIYFSCRARTSAKETIHGLLDKPGLLFVGHAETLLFSSGLLRKVAHPRAFAFRTESEVASPGRITVPEERQLYPCVKPPAQQVVYAAAPVAAADDGSKKLSSITRAEDGDVLAEAGFLADSGSLEAAERACNEFLNERGPDERAYFLLGLIDEASGDRGTAEKYYRKALYLNPRYHEALVHLTLLTKLRNPAAAEVLERRTQRIR